MKPSTFCFALALALLPSLLFSQVLFKGDFRLGDTSQVHVLNTADGSRFVGRVVGFDQERLTFLLKNQSRSMLAFPLAQVLSIEVEGAPVPPPVIEAAPPAEPQNPQASFWYTVKTKRGAMSSGKLESLGASNVRLADEKGRTHYTASGDVASIRLDSPPFTESPDAAGRLHLLKTSRGDQFAGQVQDFDGSNLTFLLKNGSVLKFSLSDLRSLRLEAPKAAFPKKAAPEAAAIASGHDKIFAAPTAFLLKKGEKEYGNHMIFFNTFDYGASDHLTVGAALHTVFSASVVSARVKLGASLGERLRVAAGGQVFGGFTFSDDGTASMMLAYGAATFGSADSHLSVAVAKGRANYEDNGFTAFTVGGAFRISDSWRLFGEYVLFSQFGDNERVFNAGAGWFSERHLVQFGLGAPFIENGGFAVPIGAYSYRF